MLRQPSRTFKAACRRRRVGLRRHGLRALEGRAAEGCARKGRHQEGGIEVAFDGADGPVVDKTPDFVKSIPVWKAVEEFDHHCLRNERPAVAALEWLSGAHRRPRLDRHLLDEARHRYQRPTKPQGGFWMNPAYRVPVGKFPIRDRFISQENATSTPITEMVVNSLITSHRDGAKINAGKVTVSGMAWDGGYGIRTGGGLHRRRQDVDVGKLGQDLGRFAFRPWSFDFTAKRARTR